MASSNMVIREECFPVDGQFVIARGARTETRAVTVSLHESDRSDTPAWGEAIPYPRYCESAESVTAQIEGIRSSIESGCDRIELLDLLPAGAARAAVDAALWHQEALRQGCPGRAIRTPTARTISLGEPEVMAASAAELSQSFRVLKLKLGGEGDVERVRAVRRAAPFVDLVADINEAWAPEDVERNSIAFAELRVGLLEQPTRPEDDEVLSTFDHPIPIAADEAFHTSAELGAVLGRYDVVNLKLEKTGGLTAALDVREEAKAAGLEIMVGCMLCTSLGIAPALHLAEGIRWVDLDAPYLLAQDRPQPLWTGDGAVGSNLDLWRCAL